MAEREGFEPSIGINLYTLSRRAPSATRTSLQNISGLPRKARKVKPVAQESQILGLTPSDSVEAAKFDINSELNPDILSVYLTLFNIKLTYECRKF